MQVAKHLLSSIDRIRNEIEDGAPKAIENNVLKKAANAESSYQNALYDGVNDVEVAVDNPDDNSWEIEASGDALMFIEFGSGVNLRHNNPWGLYEPASWSKEHEKWLVGKRLAAFKGWWPVGKTFWTQGNPSANVMYNTAKALKSEAPVEARKAIRKAFA
jgi:hypothetical protein